MGIVYIENMLYLRKKIDKYGSDWLSISQINLSEIDFMRILYSDSV